MATSGSQESPRRAGTALYFFAAWDRLAVGAGGSDFQAPYQQGWAIPKGSREGAWGGCSLFCSLRRVLPTGQLDADKTPPGNPKPGVWDFSGNPLKMLREHSGYHTQTSFHLGRKFPVSETVSRRGTSKLVARTSRGRPKLHKQATTIPFNKKKPNAF